MVANAHEVQGSLNDGNKGVVTKGMDRTSRGEFIRKDIFRKPHNRQLIILAEVFHQVRSFKGFLKIQILVHVHQHNELAADETQDVVLVHRFTLSGERMAV